MRKKIVRFCDYALYTLIVFVMGSVSFFISLVTVLGIGYIIDNSYVAQFTDYFRGIIKADEISIQTNMFLFWTVFIILIALIIFELILYVACKLTGLNSMHNGLNRETFKEILNILIIVLGFVPLFLILLIDENLFLIKSNELIVFLLFPLIVVYISEVISKILRTKTYRVN